MTKTQTMNKNYLKVLSALALFCSLNTQAQVTYTYTGAIGTYVVPPGITTIGIEAKGSKGVNGSPALGGNGATMYGEFDVTPGDILTYYVGGNAAGLQAGGDGSYVENTTTGTLYIVAGGGGGGAYSQIGAGAPTTNDGTASISHPGYVNGAPGVGGNGGGAGAGTWGTGGGGGWLSAGSNGIGSPGGAIKCKGSYGTTFAAGAGGGYSGGGGVDMDGGWGTGGGGAGGSYNVGANQSNTAANNAALGQIIISEICSAITVIVSDETICLGESFTLMGTGIGGISWDGGIENGVPYTPGSAGTFTYNSISASDADCGFSVDITVNPLPVVVANVDEEEICVGESIVLTGSGAVSYVWSPADIEDGEAYTPGAGTFTYSVVGTSGLGCENTAEVEVTVHELPEVVATATDEEICLGESLTLNGEGAATYVWSPAETDGVEFTPDATGSTTYSLTGTDDNGCENTDEIEITVYEALEITYVTTDEMAGDDGEINITVTGGSTPYSFDWDNDGSGDFDDTEDLTGLAGGTYEVVVMCDAGCSINESITLDSQLGITNENALLVTVYPNPTNEFVYIQYEGAFNYQLTSANGDLVLNGTSVNKETLDMDQLANGVYFVKITAEGKSSTVKLIKN